MKSTSANLQKEVVIKDNCHPDKEVFNLKKYFDHSHINYKTNPIQYSFMPYKLADYFRISNNGRVYTTKKLDMDILCANLSICCNKNKIFCKLELEVGFKSKLQDTKIDTIWMKIIDINDNKPSFDNINSLQFKKNKKGELELSIREDPNKNDVLRLPLAYDADYGGNRVVRYEMVDNSPSKIASMYFMLRVGSGIPPRQLQLEQLRHIDRETLSSIRFSILAIDGGDSANPDYPSIQNFRHSIALTATLSVVIRVLDINDNPPYFTKTHYSETIQEGLMPKNPLIVLKTKDKDENENAVVRYTLSSHQSSNDMDSFQKHFILDSKKGYINITKPLDYEETKLIIFNVVVKNVLPLTIPINSQMKSSSSATVTITVENVRDEQLEISLNYMNNQKMFASIEENKMDRFVAFITVKPREYGESANRIQCDIDKSYKDMLVITPTESTSQKRKYRVQLAKPLDYERNPEINAIIICISDFSNSASIKNSIPLQIKVINVNDNYPQIIFPQPHMHPPVVKEHSPIGTKVICVTAKDRDIGDFGRLKYDLSNSQEIVLTHFQINVSDGCITVRQPIDRESMDEHNNGVEKLEVTVTDYGLPPKSNSTVINVKIGDINDNKPSFSTNPMSFSIRENSPQNSAIGRVEILDRDINDIITVRLEGRDKGPFHLARDHKAQGHVFILNTTQVLNCEQKNKYKFSVIAMDGNGKFMKYEKYSKRHTVTGTIEVDVLDLNDNTPQFITPSPKNESVYRVSYKETADHKIIKISAYDADIDADNCRINYHMESNNDNSNPFKLFRVDLDKPFVYTRRDMTIHDLGEYKFVLVISDTGVPILQSRVLVTVIVDKSEPKYRQIERDNGQYTNGMLNRNNNNDGSLTNRTNKNPSRNNLSFWIIMIMTIVGVLILILFVFVLVFVIIPKFCVDNHNLNSCLQHIFGSSLRQTNSSHLYDINNSLCNKPNISYPNTNNLQYTDSAAFINSTDYNMDNSSVAMEAKQNPKYMSSTYNRYDPRMLYTKPHEQPNYPDPNHPYHSIMPLNLDHYTLQHQQYPFSNVMIMQNPLEMHLQQQQLHQQHQQQQHRLGQYKSEINLNHPNKSLLMLDETDANENPLVDPIKVWTSTSQSPMPWRSKSVMHQSTIPFNSNINPNNNININSNSNSNNNNENKFAVIYPQDESTFV